MEGYTELLLALDPWLIWAFRLSARPETGFALGLFWVALAAIFTGDLSSRLIVLCNRRHFKEMRQEMVRNHNLSLKAIAVKDKSSYKASNTLANEAFGKFFFAQIALGAASLWPVPFALGWLHYRFPDLTFPFPGMGLVGIPFLFIPLYIGARILYAGLFKRISPLRGADASEPEQERMLRMEDLVKKSEPPKP